MKNKFWIIAHGTAWTFIFFPLMKRTNLGRLSITVFYKQNQGIALIGIDAHDTPGQ